jgi:type VI secretion system ImpA family protein
MEPEKTPQTTPETTPAVPPAGAAGLDELLAPISVERPSGESLRYAGLHDEIQELRREDDATLPQGVWKRELKRADWDAVAAACSAALGSRTKDLQVAAWLLEAWLHLDGLAGCDRGLRLVRALCEGFWDDVHPQVEDGDADYRLAPLHWLAERLPAMLKSVPLTAPGSEEDGPYAWRDWEAAGHLAGLGERASAAAEAEGKVTRARFQVAVSLTPDASFRRLDADLGAVAAAAAALGAAVAERAGGAAPSFADTREVVEAMRAFTRRIVAERGGADEAAPGAEAGGETGLDGGPDDGAHTGEQPAPAAARGPIRSRSEAYRRLGEAADYLLRTEPHSPAPYLVKRAVAWGGLSLDQLLAELLARNTDLGAIRELLGMRPQEPK